MRVYEQVLIVVVGVLMFKIMSTTRRENRFFSEPIQDELSRECDSLRAEVWRKHEFNATRNGSLTQSCR